VKLALVVGSADCMWEDVKAARALCAFDAVYCVKRVGIHWPEAFQVWATLHPEYMDDYEAHRAKLGYPGGYEIVAPPSGEVGAHGHKGKIARRVSYKWPGMNASAASGIYGAKVALDDGYRVVLAGIPMTKTPHFIVHERHKSGAWSEVGQFLIGFNEALPHMWGKVKSMSGLTREKLGAPDTAWLAG
jgi:hypothetical protein